MSPADPVFLVALLRHTNLNIRPQELAAAMNLTPGAASMRLVRLRKKLASSETMVAKDVGFLLKLVELAGGKGTNFRGLADEMGLKVPAVRMRITRLRKKLDKKGGEERAEVKIEEGDEAMKLDGG
jgi:Myb-like DNA-binding domain